MSEPVKVVPASGALPAPGADNIIGTSAAPSNVAIVIDTAEPTIVYNQNALRGIQAGPNPHPRTV
jgi:hypothetical protein